MIESLETKKVRIGAVILVRNMAAFIGASVKSLYWVDGIYIYDDNSTDGSCDAVYSAASVPIIIEHSSDTRPAFAQGEKKIRNYTIDRAFEKLNCNVLVCIDADELMTDKLKPEIKRMIAKGYDSICLSLWHLYDEYRYINFRETTINGIYQVDPHTRVFIKGRYFKDIFDDGSHPTIPITSKTLVLHGLFHFHLRYFNKSPYPNYSLYYLPKRLTLKAVEPFLRPLSFELPEGVKLAIRTINYDRLEGTETFSYGEKKQTVEFVHYGCQHYRGITPCTPSSEKNRLCPSCPDYKPRGQRILVIKVGQPKEVLHTTCILEPLLCDYPRAHIYWITSINSIPVLNNLEQIHEIIPADYHSLALLEVEQFDIVLGLSASKIAARFTAMAHAKVKRGLGMDANGAVKPMNIGAYYFFQTQIFSEIKKSNQKTYETMMSEVCQLNHPVGTVIYCPTLEERKTAQKWSKSRNLFKADRIIAWDCAIENQWSQLNWQSLIQDILKYFPKSKILVLHYSEKEGSYYSCNPVPNYGRRFNAVHTESIRELAALLELCHIVVTTDSILLYLALALRRRVVILVEPSSTSKFELYGFGEKLIINKRTLNTKDIMRSLSKMINS